MKTRALFLILFIAVGTYLAFALMRYEDPFANLRALFSSKTGAAAPQPAQTPATTTAAEGPALILSAPPREDAEQGTRRFGPLAELLTATLGRKVIYRHPGTWGGYQSDMQRDAYDLVFDGPHFVSWRIERFSHHAVVKLPGEFLYVGFVRKNNSQITDIQGLAGQSVCVHAPPNLGTLLLLGQFDNPAREPRIVITEGYDKIYEGVMENRCVGGMLPRKHLAKHDVDGNNMRVIYSNPPYPEQALTAGSRLSPHDRDSIAKAIAAPGAESKLTAFREAYALGGWFVPADDQEYKGLSIYLKPVPGFFQP